MFKSLHLFYQLVFLTVRIKSFANTTGIKTFKSIIKKKKKMYDEIALLSKTDLNTIEVLISKTLTDCYINHDEFFAVNM